jgi:uncharacterized protein YdeI (YjbR/CyaY-like superfamily)
MGKRDERIDAYIAKSADFAKPILTHLRELIHKACPEVEEAWKWSFPNFMYKGSILCSMGAFKQHCTFGFWKASLMQDTDNVLELTEREAMGHLGKIESMKDLPKDATLKKYIKEAMKLNEQGIKVAPRAKATEREKAALEIPADFVKELKKNKVAQTIFNDFRYSHKKEYIQWFDEAKAEATRSKRIAQAVEWIAEGKSRNWKYINC